MEIVHRRQNVTAMSRTAKEVLLVLRKWCRGPARKGHGVATRQPPKGDRKEVEGMPGMALDEEELRNVLNENLENELRELAALQSH